MSNFSSKSQPVHKNGLGSKAGYLFIDDYYVNLDQGLKNYFFEVNFINSGFISYDACGYKMNTEESIIFENSKIYTKETLIETISLDDLLADATEVTERNINLERIRFQIDNNSALHYYALEYQTLNLILDYMEEHKPGYLSAILMKNNKGMSPLDITIVNESPKNTELLLRKLTLFKDQTLSKLFFERFNELLRMNIKAFNEYLATCFFQTEQMKSIKYMTLKSSSMPFMASNSTCLIDKRFIDKHCTDDEKKILEMQRKEREEENKQMELKQQEQEKKRQELAAKAEEEKELNNPIDEDKFLGIDNIRKQFISDSIDPGEPPVIEPSFEVSKKKKKSPVEIMIEKARSKQKKIDVMGIEFDWIFNRTQGAAFIRTLATTDNVELFSIYLIQ